MLGACSDLWTSLMHNMFHHLFGLTVSGPGSLPFSCDSWSWSNILSSYSVWFFSYIACRLNLHSFPVALIFRITYFFCLVMKLKIRQTLCVGLTSLTLAFFSNTSRTSAEIVLNCGFFPAVTEESHEEPAFRNFMQETRMKYQRSIKPSEWDLQK